MAKQNFHSIYSHGFVRAAVCIPNVKVAAPQFNVDSTLELAKQASDEKAALALFPELGLSAYSNDDLFHQDALLDATKVAISEVVAASRELLPMLLVSAPLRFSSQLFICALVIYRGKILGIVPKSYLPNYREFYEKRQFVAARQALHQQVELLGQQVPFGNDLIFHADNIDHFALHVEVCEDLWVPIPPSSYAALAGATVLANLSASNITIGKAEYRRELCNAQSARCIAAYLYSAAGPGESTTDVAWDGHALICENNEVLAESERFLSDAHMIMADIDLERLAQDRMRLSSFADCTGDHLQQIRPMRRINFTLQTPEGNIALQRNIERFPYVPNDPGKRDERCFEAYNIQIHGLLKRLQSAHIDKLVIGVSGGLDSTHALIVAAKTMDRLQLPRSNILAYTMPGFATSDTTLSNAHGLMRALEVSAHELDIRPSCLQMFKDIAHPFHGGEPVYDITFENVQAGERTSHLFRLANHHNALVLGTGDLSELALGWATYGVGDHMSHYNVNASVPKTLIQHLIRWVIDSKQFDRQTNGILQSILDTEISPELVPASDNEHGQPAQSTQEKIGPYELQDFNVYYTTRYGLRPSKIAFLSHHAWHDKTQGAWPDALAAEKHNEYDLATIKKWLQVFLFRFFKLASLSVLACRIVQKSVPVVRYRREATGAHRVTPKLKYG